MEGKRLAALTTAGTAALAVALLASGCGSNIQPSLGQYAITTGHGVLSSQQVETVAQPGTQLHVGSGTTTWYVPSDIRNYVTAPTNGDRTVSTQEITGGAKGEPGMPDTVQSYLAFELNPDIASPAGQYANATGFLSFCLKYACATQTPQNDTSNASLVRSSTPGWENMLNEILPRAIDNATRMVIANYPPSLWTNQSAWVAMGNQIAALLPGQIALLDGDSGNPYFCGPGSTSAKCAPFTFVVSKVVPANQAVVNAYNQQLAAQYQMQAAAERLAAAKAVYGPDAYYFLGMLDLANACGANTKTPSCYLYVGNPPVHP
jgi:hypothetical protein